MLSAEDKIAISETLAMHGHLFDEGRLGELERIFTADVIYDLSELGYDVLVGIDAVRDAALALGPGNPLAHIVMNIVVSATDDPDVATAHSKAVNVRVDGTTGTATYDDELVRRADGWRISHRRILPRKEPLGGLGRGHRRHGVAASDS